MKKKLIFIILLCSSFTLQGCGKYKHYVDAHKEFAKTERERIKQTPAVITAIMLNSVNIFADTVEDNVNSNSSRKPLYVKSTTLNNGEVVTEEVYSETDKVLAFFDQQEKRRARSELIKFMLPIVKEMLIQKQLEIERPLEIEDVLLEIAENTPLIATVLGFYGVSATMSDKIGNRISSDLRNGSSININSEGNTSGYTHNTFLPEEEE